MHRTMLFRVRSVPLPWGSSSAAGVVTVAGGHGFEPGTEGVHTYSKDEVGHFISRLTTFCFEAMGDARLTGDQIVDVVTRSATS
jgi:hypothetical protein